MALIRPQKRPLSRDSYAAMVIRVLFIGWSLIPICCSSGSAPSAGTSGSVPPPAASAPTKILEIIGESM